jgi:hypothetical protein
MHVQWVVEGIALIALGAGVAVVCNAGRHSERYQSGAVRSQNRFRRAIKASSVDPDRYVKGIKAGLAFGIGMGVLVIVLGVATLIRGFA